MANELIKIAGVEVEVNDDAIEPNEYFKVLKSAQSTINQNELQQALDVIADHIIQARQIGQKSFLRKLAFSGDTLIKEQVLAQKGYTKYVMIEDIKKYIDNITPKNSVKIIELERYPRVIPLRCMKDIAAAQALELFTDFCVVFTDFTERDYKTPEEKKQVARNRDPIVFGFFKDDLTGEKHHRFYFITDWEDDYCGLTFSRLLTKLGESGVKKPGYVITTGPRYIEGIINDALRDTEDDDKGKKKQKTFWERLGWPSQKK